MPVILKKLARRWEIKVRVSIIDLTAVFASPLEAKFDCRGYKQINKTLVTSSRLN